MSFLPLLFHLFSLSVSMHSIENLFNDLTHVVKQPKKYTLIMWNLHVDHILRYIENISDPYLGRRRSIIRNKHLLNSPFLGHTRRISRSPCREAICSIDYYGKNLSLEQQKTQRYVNILLNKHN